MLPSTSCGVLAAREGRTVRSGAAPSVLRARAGALWWLSGASRSIDRIEQRGPRPSLHGRRPTTGRSTQRCWRACWQAHPPRSTHRPPGSRTRSRPVPVGPNQPMNPTVGIANRLPTSAIATGIIRTTVRLRIAYRTGRRSPDSRRIEPTNVAPKTVHTPIDRRIPAVSLKSSARSSEWRVTPPKARPARNAAMKPLPPRATEAK